MSKKPLTTAIVAILIVATIAPATLLIAPQKTFAQSSGSGCVVGLAAGLAGILPQATVSVPVSNPSGSTGSWTTAGSSVGSCLYNLIVIPALRSMIRDMLRQMTQATINWVNGGNGTGQPSFVQNLSVHLQGIGDAVANPFITQISTVLNSPFGPAIASSLQTAYVQQTSMAGFYAANQCTLPGTVQSQQAFLAGNWSQGGGLATWFSLTSPTQNNPYILQQTALAQLGSNVSQAQTNRRQDLIQSGGILSFCGGNTTTKNVNVGITGRGINPQVTCTNPDGTMANATTPGSAIESYLQANVNSGIGQLVSAQDLDAAIGQIVSSLANNILGPTGLFGASQPSSSNNVTGTTAFTVTAPSVNQLIGTQDSPASQAVSALGNSALAGAGVATATSSGTTLAQSVISQVAAYTTAWNSIISAANTASTSVAALVSSCNAAANTAAQVIVDSSIANGGLYTPTTDLSTIHSTFIDAARAQAIAAQPVPATEIAPVIAQAQASTTAVSATQAFALKVQAEATAVPVANPTQLNADILLLTSMPPASSDVSYSQMNATATAIGGSTANPAGSLTVSGGTLIDRMNLINTNAQTLQSTVCNPGSSLYVTTTVSG